MLAKVNFTRKALVLGMSGHPGRFPALFFMLMGFLIPLSNDKGLTHALVGLAIMSIFWIPVVWTAYKAGRNKMLSDRFMKRIEPTITNPTETL